MLSMYINSTHTNWDEILPYVTFAYSSRQESTGRTPFYLTYGREARLPVDVAIGATPSIGSNDPLTVARNLETAREEVRTRLEQVQERQKGLYDAKHREALEFIPGEEVLVYKPFRKVGRSEKLLHRWLGPYVVVRRASALNYEVKKPRSKQKELAHVVRIKRFVRNGEWTVTENGQNNEVTGVTGRTVPRPLEKSSGGVGAATQVETGRPKGRAVETSADQGQQEEAGTNSHPETEGATLRRSTRTRRAPDRFGPSGEASAVGALLLLLGLLGPLMGVQPSQGL
jgi:hypothetical protein